MRFKTAIRNIQKFSSNVNQLKLGLKLIKILSELTASLSYLGKVAWIRLDDDAVRLTVIPEIGTQVWASLSIDSIFEDYTIQSAALNNTINLELPLQPLNRALKSAIHASSASIRLTKKDGLPVLSLTIVTYMVNSGNAANGFLNEASKDNLGDNMFEEESLDAAFSRDRETVVTQDIPIRVLTAESVEGIHEPRVREPEAHIMLPSLLQLKAISDRFTKLALATSGGTFKAGSSLTRGPRLELAANMHGSLKLSITTDALNISSVWTGLTNPVLDPRQVEDGEGSLEDHPSTKLRDAGPDAWSTVRIDGRDWGRVLSVGRLGGRVIACFADEHALILYVYLSSYDESDESVLTYYISSFSV
ncbi:Checkpoint protein hus1 [Golovinomyces cichoracearum]|uniref:Checkpoint protein n=1 Tax=Golovinomyces cichoracearum TaxID=62708 RepID=A0A420IX47_9PEZI|nr:Checkpoint protein hus1 [Golovinomyces cichoracearum]